MRELGKWINTTKDYNGIGSDSIPRMLGETNIPRWSMLQYTCWHELCKHNWRNNTYPTWNEHIDHEDGLVRRIVKEMIEEI